MTVDVERFVVVDPTVAAEVRTIAEQRPDPFARGEPHDYALAERTKALIEGATVFVPCDKPTRNWRAWYASTMKRRGLKVRQLFAEYKGETGHFLWTIPLDTPKRRSKGASK